MKGYFILVLFSFFATLAFTQSHQVVREELYSNGRVKLQFVEVTKTLVKATYFHDNGMVSETGYYLNEKLYGYWETFDFSENKIASGFFENNEKTGDWNYWKDGELIQVISYSNSIAVN